MNFSRTKRFFQFDTAGWMAVSALIMCCISGVLLAIPYDFFKAYESVFELLMLNPVGSFIRNLHYWSAQLFFITFILHVYDHFSKSTETNIRSNGTWFFLSLVIIFAGYEMISGFMLKGDASAVQARMIITSMLESIPIAGKMLSSAFTGSGDHWLIVYVQHIATGTIFLFIGIYEHVRTLWPRLKTLFIVLLALLIISFFLRAPLGFLESNQLRGPWFFVGVQEMLHQTSHPGYVTALFILLIFSIFFLTQLPQKIRDYVKIGLLFAGVFYLFLTAFVFLFRGENWELKPLSLNTTSDGALLIYDPVNFSFNSTLKALPANQKPESCLLCHSGMKGLSDSHNPLSTGCFACHGGDPFSPDKQRSHKNMFRVPGDFSNVRQTCGTQDCHAEIARRIQNSLMATQSGIIGVDKFVFGETKSLNDTFRVASLGHSAADTHLRNLCAGCHLGKEKSATGNAGWLGRGGCCNACHLRYDASATASMKLMQSGGSQIHSAIDIRVSNDQCKSCHSRSGRISLSYEGWNETSLKTAKDTIHYKVLPDERVLEFVQADIHHQKGMACIDCHTSYELMGDGKSHRHKEDAVSVQCVDCHPTGKPSTISLENLKDRESQMIAGLRKYDPKSKIVVTATGRQALLNTSVSPTGQVFLTDKLNGQLHLSKPQSPVCSKGKGHDRLTCQSCHTAWVPQCIGCHNTFEKETSGYDLLTGKTTKGTWVEYAGKNYAELPVLGVNENNGGHVVTAMPGMIMTIEKQFYRLYAPASGHTTQREARSCKSCHNDPLALGFGRGELRYEISGGRGIWRFAPMFALNPNDKQPEDAWTGLLKEALKPFATREDLRPFNVQEQQRILEVGSCLTCHEGKSQVMLAALDDFRQTLAKRKKACVAPSW
ncbi:MAG: multiheme c-type cytochrome [Prolixibacteraceae bacterium]